jgi:hypothetical protein
MKLEEKLSVLLLNRSYTLYMKSCSLNGISDSLSIPADSIVCDNI